jgi:membrane protein required for colicin V production
MYWLDTLLLALIALGAILGFFSGFLWQVGRILTLVLALFATVASNDTASRFCQEQLLRDADPRVSQVVAYVAVFLLVYIVLYLATRLLYEGIRATELVVFDRLLGGVFGAGKMALVLGLCCLAAANYPHATAHEWMAKSALAPAFANGIEHALVVIPDEYKENLRGTLVSLRDLLNRPPAGTQQEQPDTSAKTPPPIS